MTTTNKTRTWRLVIDGPSGAGKTQLATRLARQANAQIVHMDHLYPGWDGLKEGSKAVENILTGPASYRQWNWEKQEWGRTQNLDPNKNWIIEGCGSLTKTTRKHVDYAIWLEVDPQVGKQRALKRDGDMFRPHWEQWHQQEEQHWKENEPWTLADQVIAT